MHGGAHYLKQLIVMVEEDMAGSERISCDWLFAGHSNSLSGELYCVHKLLLLGPNCFAGSSKLFEIIVVVGLHYRTCV